MLQQTEIPNNSKPQVSVYAALKAVFGEQRAEVIWRQLAANPGRDIIAEVKPGVYEMLNIMRTKPV